MPRHRPAIPGAPSKTIVYRLLAYESRTRGNGRSSGVIKRPMKATPDVTRVPANRAEKASGLGDAGRLIEWRI